MKSVLKILADQGVELCRKKIPKDVFCRYPNIMLANALMGAVKVLSIDNKRIEHTKGLGSMINQHLKKGDAGIKQKVS
jgi:para-aminobenzoate synthetase component 1